MRSVLIVEDNPAFAGPLSEILRRSSYAPRVCSTLAEARSVLEQNAFEVIVVDQGLPDGHGLDLIRDLSSEVPAPQMIMIAGMGDVPVAVEAIQNGALDYLVKPFDLEEFSLKVDRAFQIASTARKARFTESSIRSRGTYYPLGNTPSEAFQEIFRLIETYAGAAPSPVLITGETGVGKERAARSLHARSERANMPFVALNCANFDTPLLESELFGHEKGAFTSASERKVGMVELAHGGTLFLDEIGDMPLAAQAKLLRAIETRSFRRVGGTREIKSDFWVISATNQEFEKLIAGKQFRADLYYRLSTLVLNIPPLRDRISDIPDLVGQICRELLGKHSGEVSFDTGVLQAFEQYTWPGNIRELRNIVERSLIVNKDHVIRLPPGFLSRPQGDTVKQHSGANSGNHGNHGTDADSASVLCRLSEAVGRAERDAVISALKAAGGSRSGAAEILGVSLATLKRLVKEHNLYDW